VNGVDSCPDFVTPPCNNPNQAEPSCDAEVQMEEVQMEEVQMEEV
jgi:hypothetical protein